MTTAVEISMQLAFNASMAGSFPGDNYPAMKDKGWEECAYDCFDDLGLSLDDFQTRDAAAFVQLVTRALSTGPWPGSATPTSA